MPCSQTRHSTGTSRAGKPPKCWICRTCFEVALSTVTSPNGTQVPWPLPSTCSPAAGSTGISPGGILRACKTPQACSRNPSSMGALLPGIPGPCIWSPACLPKANSMAICLRGTSTKHFIRETPKKCSLKRPTKATCRAGAYRTLHAWCRTIGKTGEALGLDDAALRAYAVQEYQRMQMHGSAPVERLDIGSLLELSA